MIFKRAIIIMAAVMVASVLAANKDVMNRANRKSTRQNNTEPADDEIIHRSINIPK